MQTGNDTFRPKQIEPDGKTSNLVLLKESMQREIFLRQMLGIQKLVRVFENNESKHQQQYSFIMLLKLNDTNANRYMEFKWEQHKNSLIEEKRFPITELSSQRQQMEVHEFDLQRKRFWQNRFITLFTSILRNQRRRERLIKVVGFHRFLRNAAMMTAPLHRNISFQNASTMNNTMALDYHYDRESKVTRENKSKQPNLNQKPTTNRSNTINKSKSPISKQQPPPKPLQQQQNEDFKANQALKAKFRKQHAALRLYFFRSKKEFQTTQQLSLAFTKWFKFSVEWDNVALQDELQSINFVLSERVFRENLFRTKIRLAKSEMESKMNLINEMVQHILASHR